MVLVRYPVQYEPYFTEEQEVRDEWWHPEANQTVLDIGCMMGNYALPALEAGAFVIAVDPNVFDTNAMKNIAWMNGWHKRLTVFNVALYDGGDYPQDMKDAMAASEYAHLQPPADAKFMTLDELVGDLGVHLIKMDVEGAEYGILQGGVKCLEKWHPMLLIEDHSIPYEWVRDNDITGKCSRLLEGLGYSVEQWKYDEKRMFLVAS